MASISYEIIIQMLLVYKLHYLINSCEASNINLLLVSPSMELNDHHLTSQETSARKGAIDPLLHRQLFESKLQCIGQIVLE